MEMIGPTLVDMRIRLNSNTEDIAFAVSGRSYGLFPGSIIGGFLADKFTSYWHLIVAIALDIIAAGTASIPWSPNVWTMWSLCFVTGSLESVVNIGKLKHQIETVFLLKR